MDLTRILTVLSPYLDNEEEQEIVDEDSEERNFVELVNRFIQYDPISASINFLNENESFLETLLSVVSDIDFNNVRDAVNQNKTLLNSVVFMLPRVTVSIDSEEFLI